MQCHPQPTTDAATKQRQQGGQLPPVQPTCGCKQPADAAACGQCCRAGLTGCGHAQAFRDNSLLLQTGMHTLQCWLHQCGNPGFACLITRDGCRAPRLVHCCHHITLACRRMQAKALALQHCRYMEVGRPCQPQMCCPFLGMRPRVSVAPPLVQLEPTTPAVQPQEYTLAQKRAQRLPEAAPQTCMQASAGPMCLKRVSVSV